MTETITIDGLPEGYYVEEGSNYYNLRGPGGHHVEIMSKQFKPSTIEKRFITEAELHAAGHRANVEKAFCQGFTTEQLEAVSLAEIMKAWKLVKAETSLGTILSSDETYTKLTGARATFAKLEPTEAKP